MVTIRICFAGKVTRECLSRGYGTFTQSGIEDVDLGALISELAKETILRWEDIVVLGTYSTIGVCCLVIL